MLYHENLAVIS